MLQVLVTVETLTQHLWCVETDFFSGPISGLFSMSILFVEEMHKHLSCKAVPEKDTPTTTPAIIHTETGKLLGHVSMQKSAKMHLYRFAC